MKVSFSVLRSLNRNIGNMIAVKMIRSKGKWGVIHRPEHPFLRVKKKQMKQLKEDWIRRFRTSQQVFTGQEEDDREYLQLFAFICALGFDVYMKKQTMELLIDQIREEFPGDGKKKK